MTGVVTAENAVDRGIDRGGNPLAHGSGTDAAMRLRAGQSLSQCMTVKI